MSISKTYTLFYFFFFFLNISKPSFSSPILQYNWPKLGPKLKPISQFQRERERERELQFWQSQRPNPRRKPSSWPSCWDQARSGPYHQKKPEPWSRLCSARAIRFFRVGLLHRTWVWLEWSLETPWMIDCFSKEKGNDDNWIRVWSGVIYRWGRRERGIWGIVCWFWIDLAVRENRNSFVSIIYCSG